LFVQLFNFFGKMLAGAFKKLQDVGTRTIYGTEKICTITSLFDIVDKNMSGNQVQMSDFKEMVLIAVNVASK